MSLHRRVWVDGRIVVKLKLQYTSICCLPDLLYKSCNKLLCITSYLGISRNVVDLLRASHFMHSLWVFCRLPICCTGSVEQLVIQSVVLQGGPRYGTIFYVLTSSNINRSIFFKFFTVGNRKIFLNTITINSITPQVCCYTTLWNVSVLKATIKTKLLQQYILRN